MMPCLQTQNCALIHTQALLLNICPIYHPVYRLHLWASVSNPESRDSLFASPRHLQAQNGWQWERWIAFQHLDRCSTRTQSASEARIANLEAQVLARPRPFSGDCFGVKGSFVMIDGPNWVKNIYMLWQEIDSHTVFSN